MSVDVSAGAAIMNGFIYYNDEPKHLTLKAAHATLPRIDSIMLRWDISASSINAVVIEGTPKSNPVAPAPVRSSTIFEFQLATVRVSAGVSSITAANITDTRPNQAVCGITSGYNGVNIDAMMTQYTAEFNEWFEAIKDQLTEDAAGNLQTQLDAHTGDEEIHITAAERTKWNAGSLVSGSSEAGSYLKFPDGTMLAWGVVTVEGVPANGPKAGYVPFPAAFIAPPTVTATAVADTGKGAVTTQIGTLRNAHVYIFVYNAITVERTTPVHWHALGRWK